MAWADLHACSCTRDELLSARATYGTACGGPSMLTTPRFRSAWGPFPLCSLDLTAAPRSLLRESIHLPKANGINQLDRDSDGTWRGWCAGSWLKLPIAGTGAATRLHRAGTPSASSYMIYR